MGFPRLLVIAASLGLAGCAGAPPSSSSRPEIEIGQFYVIHCTILGDHAEVLKSFPAAKACIFFKDGSFIASSNDPRRLGRIDKYGRIVWSRDLPTHHQLKISADGEKILTLGADVREGDLGRVRFDDFLVVSAATGETLHRWSGYEHRKEYLDLIDHVPTQIRPPSAREGLDYLYEYTHFNSIDEIPENPTSRSIPAFKKGNYLVGLNGLGTFAILDPELKQIIWTMPDPMFDGDTGHNTRAFHDLQILPNGHLLVFNNQLGVGPDPGSFRLREIDPVTRKTVWQYPEHESIQVGGAGSVQVLPDGYLFNTNFMLDGRESGATFMIDREGHEVWTLQETGPAEAPVYTLSTTPLGQLKSRGNQFQEFKKVDVRDFLKNTAL